MESLIAGNSVARSIDPPIMKRIGPILLSAAVVLAACGSGDDAVTVDDVWARASAPTQTAGAVYFDLTVAEDDTLVGATVPASIATHAEIHEVVMVADDDMAGDDMDMSDDMSMDDSADMDDMDMSDDMSMDGTDDTGDMDMGDGQMRMQELPDGLALTGGETVSFEPGSYHVMLPELVAPLAIGDEFELTLDFANADDVTVTVKVAETAP